MGAIVPAAIMGGSAIGSALLGRKTAKDLQKSATTLTPAEEHAQGRMTTMADTLYGQGQEGLGRATNYYETLLGKGGRGAMESLVSPQAERIADIYGGAGRGVESELRGGAKEYALSELAREKAGRISGLTRGLQFRAADRLADVGRFGTGTAASAFSDILGRGQGNRQLGWQAGAYAQQQTTQMGRDLGSLIFSLMAGGAGKGGGKKYEGLPVGTPNTGVRSL
jgi:hypothetical protein